MRILGIDPGIGKTGWGIVETQGSKIKVINYGCVETEPNSDISGRLFAIHDEIARIIAEHRPECMAVEELFFGKNIKTAFVVGQARGVILLSGAENNLQITIYTPLQVKIALTGYGRAEKQQVGKMVKTILALKEIPKPDDTADALAVALTHAFSYRSSR